MRKLYQVIVQLQGGRQQVNDDKEVIRILGALQEGMKHLLAAHEADIGRMNRIDENVESIDERLRNVEKKQYTVFVIATAAWTCIVGWIVKHFG